MITKAYIIEGAPNSGKSTLVYAQYLRLMNTDKYRLVENEFPNSLTGFRLLIEHKKTKECIFFNSPTDNKVCINDLKKFHTRHSANYNITKIVTSSRDDNNIHLKSLVHQFIDSLTSNKTVINITPLLSI